MKRTENTPLADFTSLKVGGPAEVLYVTETFDETMGLLIDEELQQPVTLLGYGSNSLISDKGLPGTTIVWRGGNIELHDDIILADAGAWWDDVVIRAIDHGLWGLELMSEIPSSVGGAVVGNIAAYGQQISDTLKWVDIYDARTKKVTRHEKSDFVFEYRHSSLQDNNELLVLRAGFQLSYTPTTDLKYAGAVKTAEELGYDIGSLSGRRMAIIETRARAGSIYHPDDPSYLRTAGSFFKNPLVTTEQAIELASFDESGATLERIKQQSLIHGGDSRRASAAHVLLAVGYNRGQSWGHVRLHPSHVLKLEAREGATAQEVYDTAQEIISTVKHKLNITIEPEVRFIGDFSK